jgi:hypothetical protein
VSEDGIHLAGMHYRALIVEGSIRVPKQARPALERLCRAGRLIAWGDTASPFEGAVRASAPQELLAAIDRLCPGDLSIAPPSADLRYRHVVVDRDHLYILCNEGQDEIAGEVQTAVQGAASWVDPWLHKETPVNGTPSMTLAPYTTMILRVTP